jgi:histidinol-phosphate/aromatic aminotransferase/cobyric acid decarboxylase-like protein
MLTPEVLLSSAVRKDLADRGVSRRSFARIAGFLAAASSLPFSDEAAFAQASKVDAPPGAIMINANENPLGPCKEALEALHKIAAQGGRYLYGETENVQKLLAESEGLKADHVRIYPGSSAPLHQTVLAFCSPAKPLVMGDPGYEAGANAAEVVGAKTCRIPLTKAFAHDVRAMAAVPNSGVIYITNPNNPTGTVTPQADIEWLVANKPAGSVLMLDEAYMHISPNPQFNTALVSAGKDIVILRTFSKIYGMAGLRAGAVLARPDLIAKLDRFSNNGMLPITGMAAAAASLQVKTLLAERRKIIGDIREDVFAYLEKKKLRYTPSVTNCFMVDTGKPTNDVILAMRRENIYIGRPWPVWPTHVRITVGTRDEMEKFKIAFSKVLASA